MLIPDSGVKTVANVAPDENGNVDLQIKDLKEQKKLVRKNQLEEFNETITKQLNHKAEKGEVGSPLTADSVNDMTDTSRVYVNSADGNWYSYNGTEWVVGGTYNSEGLGKGTVRPIHLVHEIKSDITEKKPLDLTFENNTFWDTRTSVAVKNTFTGYYRTSEIETYEGQEFLISIQIGTSDKQEAIVVADNEYNILWKIYDVNDLTKLDNYALTIPASGTKLLLTDYSLDSNIEVKTDIYSGVASKSYLESKLADIGFNNEFAGGSFSVLGDSTSAYIGHIPDGNAYYYNGSNSGVSDVSEMWWSVLAENTGMTPLIINAWSGSKVSSIDVEGKGFVPASDISRAQNLHDDTNNPDNIFIKMGINDFTKTGAAIGTWDGGSTLPADNGDFSSAYALMLSRVREAYPNTRIFCLSLGIFIRTNTDKNGVEYNDEGKTIHDYNEVIRKMCNLFGATYIDTQNIGITRQNIYPTYAEDYSSIPTHYNTVGHLVLGESVAKKTIQN